MKLHKESHLDHGLTPEQVAHVVSLFADRSAFFIETIELPESLGTARCDLYGPLVGLPAVPESEVRYEKRGARTWESRLIECAYPRTSRMVTVIAGPHDGEPCIVYTMYGGPLAPQEPGDPGCKDVDASREFWSKHALVSVAAP